MHIRRALIWILSTLSVFFIGDLICRLIVSCHLDNDSMDGIYGPVDHALRHFDDDIVILGSSVAVYNISAKAIEDSLGLKTYCAGAVGQSMDFHLIMLRAIVSQHKPETVILNIVPQNLCDASKKSMKHNKYLLPYYGMGIDGIDDALTESDRVEKALLSLYAYRFNHIWTRLLLYDVFRDDKARQQGSYTQGIPDRFPDYGYLGGDMAVSDYILTRLHKIIGICNDNGIDLIVTMAPLCALPPVGVDELTASKQCKAMARELGFAFYDDTRLPPFDRDSTLYHDWLHLNVNGTEIYTDTIIARIKAMRTNRRSALL